MRSQYAHDGLRYTTELKNGEVALIEAHFRRRSPQAAATERPMQTETNLSGGALRKGRPGQEIGPIKYDVGLKFLPSASTEWGAVLPNRKLLVRLG